MNGEPRTLRYTWPWRAIGVLFIFLAFAFPALMVWNHERIDAVVILGLAAMAAYGAGCLIYFLRFRVVLSDQGLQIRRWSERRFAWSEVVSMQAVGRALRFELGDQRHVDVPLQMPNVHAVVDAATAHMTQTAWQTPR